MATPWCFDWHGNPVGPCRSRTEWANCLVWAFALPHRSLAISSTCYFDLICRISGNRFRSSSFTWSKQSLILSQIRTLMFLASHWGFRFPDKIVDSEEHLIFGCMLVTISQGHYNQLFKRGLWKFDTITVAIQLISNCASDPCGPWHAVGQMFVQSVIQRAR